MPFKPVTELEMPKGVSLRSLTFGDDGHILITGNNDHNVRVWDVTTLVWADQPRRDMVDGSAVLCVGSGRGFIGMVPFSKTYEGIVTGIMNTAAFPLDHPIKSVAYDSVLRRIVAASHFEQIKVYRVLASNTLEPLWQAASCNHIPIGLVFWGPQNDKIIATLLQSGDITCYSSATGAIEWCKRLSGAIGGSALSQDSSKLLVNNLTTNNFDLFSFPDIIKLRTFTIPETSTSHKIKMGIFAGISNELVLCGSLHDKVYLFDSVTGACLGGLHHGKEAHSKPVQMLASHHKHLHVFASGSSGKICIWKDVVLPTERPKNAVETKGTFTLLGLLTDTRFLVILLGLHVTYSTWYPYASQVYHIAVYPSITWLNNFYHSIVAYISAA
ncbi:WD40 repeat-like protein [Pleurotus eryngii]|uniref:WD40 repeat-like protein n=1 Tax=Pleurotus eryngii TaxID=5323 RepID=A0A9P5ZSM3_PLEER|nr:WD40 repeat-like protein [Pleurotus eryngii]